MRKYSYLISLIAVVLLIGALAGCDNRSQLEKDADRAAEKVKKSLR